MLNISSLYVGNKNCNGISDKLPISYISIKYSKSSYFKYLIKHIFQLHFLSLFQCKYEIEYHFGFWNLTQVKWIFWQLPCVVYFIFWEINFHIYWILCTKNPFQYIFIIKQVVIIKLMSYLSTAIRLESTKSSPVLCRGGLSKRSNVKMS